MILPRCEGCGDLLPASRRRAKWHERCRKRQYGGCCVECGARTSRRSSDRCETCHQRKRHEDACARVVEQMRRWHREHGEPPKAQDWNPVLARRRGEDAQALRAERGGWPHTTVVVRLFGTWNKAIEAAGYEPRSHKPD